MTGTEATLFGAAVALILNFAGIAYSYGKSTQKLNDLCRRMDRVENLLNGKGEKK